MYKKLLSITLCLSILALALSVLPIHGEAEIYDSVLRLHVLANSDSKEDQALKLSVRDNILEYTESILSGCASREEAQAVLQGELESIRSIAAATVAEAGYGYSVSVAFDLEDYPTRNYESCCFPSGEYMSLRIMIGEAAGQNWWCVLFPPMCLSAASECNGALQAGLTDEQYKIITETENVKYKIRFKLLETIEDALK